MTSTENWARVMIPAVYPKVAEIVPKVSPVDISNVVKAALPGGVTAGQRVHRRRT